MPFGACLTAASASWRLWEPARRLPTRARTRVLISTSLQPITCLRQQVYTCLREQASGIVWGMALNKAVPPLTAQEKKVISALHTAFTAMMRQFDADLRREQRLSHTEYIALMFLSEAPERTLGLSDLAARCQQSLSTISRTVGRLEAQGLVRREQSTRDARAYNAVLNDALPRGHAHPQHQPAPLPVRPPRGHRSRRPR
jgi:DNA-binding MarR family transcriptional regulator